MPNSSSINLIQIGIDGLKQFTLPWLRDWMKGNICLLPEQLIAFVHDAPRCYPDRDYSSTWKLFFSFDWPVSNFNNILHTPFSYKSVICSFSLVTVFFVIFWHRIWAQKQLVTCWWNWLLVQFHQYFTSTDPKRAKYRDNFTVFLRSWDLPHKSCTWTCWQNRPQLRLCSCALPHFLVS
jgi:hypothetical protein